MRSAEEPGSPAAEQVRDAPAQWGLNCVVLASGPVSGSMCGWRCGFGLSWLADLPEHEYVNVLEGRTMSPPSHPDHRGVPDGSGRFEKKRSSARSVNAESRSSNGLVTSLISVVAPVQPVALQPVH
jgi:hypothetical protein